MFSIVTFSNLYFTLVILTEVFEEEAEEGVGDTHYSLLSVNCIYDDVTHNFFSSWKNR